MILEAFEVLENAHKMGTHIRSFKEYLASYINREEEFYVGDVPLFVSRSMLLINESRKQQYFPSNFRIRQIQVGWKGRIDIMKSLKKKCSPLEDKKSVMLFKISDAIVELGGLPLVRYFSLISSDVLQIEVSKLNKKWAREFDNLTNFSKERITAWNIDYVNSNNNI